MVVLNWIEVLVFFSDFRHKNLPRLRFSDLSPQRIHGTRGYALTVEEFP